MRTKTLYFLAVVIGVVGSASQPDAPARSVPIDDGMSEAALSSNEHTAFNFFVSKGLTKTQSAGIIGNLMQESSVIPSAVEYGGGPGRGIAQWSVGGRWDTDHDDNVTWYASAHGESSLGARHAARLHLVRARDVQRLRPRRRCARAAR